MTREEVLAVIKKHIKATLEDVDVESIDPDRSMRDYDANSLDVVEIISGTMRDLRTKVPREELENVKSINGLVDAFLRHMAP